MKFLQAILRFERHLKGIEKLKGENLSDYLIYNTLAMECFQGANALIEIGEQVVSRHRLGLPSSYAEVFLLLHKGGFLGEEELGKARRLVFLRNLIAHEYHRMTEDELLEMANLLIDMKEFVERMKKEVV